MTKSELVGNATTELSYHILRDNGKYSYLFSIQNMIDFCYVFPKNWKYFNFVFWKEKLTHQDLNSDFSFGLLAG